MKTINTLEQADRLTYDTLPRDGGQMVQVSYCHHEDGYLYRRSYDQSDKTLTITRAVVDEDIATPYEPQNGILPETVGDDEEMLPEALGEMIRVVGRHGDAYTGGVARYAAQGWIDAEFSADDADEWMDAGWWDADRAASARDLGLTPSQTDDDPA